MDAPISGNSDRWHMQGPDGGQYGPVTRADLDQWVRDGRVNAQCQLLQEGWTTWQPAAQVYPQLSGGSSSRNSSLNNAANPYANPTLSGAAGYSAATGGNYGYVKPHRGNLILILGILSIVFCQFVGIPAWLMGSQDLKEMKAGLMDPSGEGMTQAGRVCGIVGCVIMILQLVLFFFYLGGF